MARMTRVLMLMNLNARAGAEPAARAPKVQRGTRGGSAARAAGDEAAPSKEGAAGAAKEGAAVPPPKEAAAPPKQQPAAPPRTEAAALVKEAAAPPRTEAAAPPPKEAAPPPKEAAAPPPKETRPKSARKEPRPNAPLSDTATVPSSLAEQCAQAVRDMDTVMAFGRQLTDAMKQVPQVPQHCTALASSSYLPQAGTCLKALAEAAPTHSVTELSAALQGTGVGKTLKRYCRELQGAGTAVQDHSKVARCAWGVAAAATHCMAAADMVTHRPLQHVAGQHQAAV